MAEEQTPAVRNKGRLIAAAVIGLIVVIIYLWHIGQVRNKDKGRTVEVLAFNRMMSAGEEIGADDLRTELFDRKQAAGLGDVITEPKAKMIGFTLNQSVKRNEYLRSSHIIGDTRSRPSQSIGSGKEAFPLEVDIAPGTILSVGDRVVLIGSISVDGKPARPYRIIEGVRVVEIGGRAGSSNWVGSKSRSDSSQRKYRTLTVEVTAQTALKLHAVLSRVEDKIRVNVLSPAGESAGYTAEPQVNAELQKLGPAPVMAPLPAP